ncbi:hypothetical protein D3C72_2138220 [compost metagenome]
MLSINLSLSNEVGSPFPTPRILPPLIENVISSFAVGTCNPFLSVISAVTTITFEFERFSLSTESFIFSGSPVVF